MVYYKLILDTRRSKFDGLYPICVRITYNKTNTTITTGVRVREEHWDANKQRVTKSNANFQNLNQSISEIYLKLQKAILKLQDENQFSIDALKLLVSEKIV